MTRRRKVAQTVTALAVIATIYGLPGLIGMVVGK